MDGTSWELKIKLKDEFKSPKFKRIGLNAYPPHFYKLLKTLNKYGLPKIKI